MGLRRATEAIKRMQTTLEPSARDLELTTREWNLVALLVARRAMECNGHASDTLRGLLAKLLRDRSTTPRLGGDA